MLRPLCTTLTLCLLFGRPVAADPLTVTSGFVIFTDEPGAFSLAGSDFVLTGEWFPSGVDGRFWHDQCQPCEPGSVVDFGTTTYEFSASNVSYGSSSGVLGGTSYAELFLDAHLTFSGPRTVVPESLAAVAGGSFNLDGRIVAYLDPLRTSAPVWSGDLRGSGTAVVSFQPSGFLSELEYRFTDANPIPEPSTLVLVATALAAGARRFTNRRLRNQLQTGEATMRDR